MWQLVGTEGEVTGRSWFVGEADLYIGRDRECGIRLSDSLSSRKHCKLSGNNAGLSVEDLGSSNATLVNGLLIERVPLKAGDVISVGSCVFILASTGLGDENAAGDDNRSTIRLLSEDVLLLDQNLSPSLLAGHPTTIQDLILLYRLGNDVSAVESIEGLIRIFGLELVSRFRPDAWFLIFGDDVSRGAAAEYQKYEGSFLCARGKSPRDFMWTALSDSSGVLLKELPSDEQSHAQIFTLCAGIGLGRDTFGGVGIQRHASRGTYSKSDLECLVAICRTIAPYFRTLERQRVLLQQNQLLQAETLREHVLIGESALITSVRALIHKAAATNLPVLITGETGTGKELAARTVHTASARSAKPFVTVNCAAIPEELFESEMFGHEKGAFTGARERRIGRFEQADGGTLFLDEIGELSTDEQAKLLRTVESGSLARIGSSKEIRVDVRIVAATNQNLKAAVESGRFRLDLYHRLLGFHISMPSLREHPQDIEHLATFFVHDAASRTRTDTPQLSGEVLTILRNWPWRGNVRELRACIERAVALADGPVILPEHILLSDLGTDAEPATTSVLSEAESGHILRVLEQNNWNMRASARSLGIARSTLYRKLEQFHIQLPGPQQADRP
jgi:DNA-binding NtrC family response regulator